MHNAPTRSVRSAPQALGVFPSPLWGGVGGGGGGVWQRWCVTRTTPLPHRGGGSRPSWGREQTELAAPVDPCNKRNRTREALLPEQRADAAPAVGGRRCRLGRGLDLGLAVGAGIVGRVHQRNHRRRHRRHLARTRRALLPPAEKGSTGAASSAARCAFSFSSLSGFSLASLFACRAG